MNQPAKNTESAPAPAAALRQQAEATLREQTSRSPEILAPRSPDAMQQTIHELRIHQIELEMQNEELRRTQAALDLTKARYFDFYDLAPVGYLTVSEAGLIREANLTASTLLGVPREALDQQPFSRFILPADADNFYRLSKQIFKTREPQAHELRLVKRDGSVFWARLQAIAVPAESGLTELRIVLSDITKSKQAEVVLRASEQLNQEILNSITDAFIALTDDMVVSYFNPAAERVLNRKRADVIGRNLFATFPEAKGSIFEEKYAQAIRTKLSLSFEVLFAVAPYQNWYEVRVYPSQEGITIYFQVITARKQAAQALQAKNAEIERFAYAVSHDLKSPLVTIKTFLGYLEEDIRDQNVERMPKDLAYIHGAADKMVALLDGVLTLSRVGRLQNPSVEVPLQEIVQEALNLVAGQIVKRGVQVTVTPEPVWLYGDRPRLAEIFQNLVDNAVKFMGAQPAPRIEIGLEATGGEPELFVRDNGQGFDPGLQAKIFGLFQRLDPNVPGTGIGLALVKRIVEVHGGQIRAESAGEGHGATFRFTLARTRREG